MKNQKIAVGSENSNQSVVVNSIKNESLIYLMKNFCLLITIFIVALNNTFGKIKNGYENEIFALKESLKIHGTLLHGDTVLTAYQRKKIEHGIDSLVSEISKYEFTENLLTIQNYLSRSICGNRYTKGYHRQECGCLREVYPCKCDEG